MHSSNPAGKWVGYNCSLNNVCVLVIDMKDPLKATHQWGALCEGGNTGRNGRGALLISRLLRFSYVKLSWMCLGSEIDVMARALEWMRREGFKVQSLT